MVESRQANELSPGKKVGACGGRFARFDKWIKERRWSRYSSYWCCHQPPRGGWFPSRGVALARPKAPPLLGSIGICARNVAVAVYARTMFAGLVRVGIRTITIGNQEVTVWQDDQVEGPM